MLFLVLEKKLAVQNHVLFGYTFVLIVFLMHLSVLEAFQTILKLVYT